MNKSFSIIKRIIATLILIYLTSQIFYLKTIFFALENSGIQGYFFKKFSEWISNLLGQPNFYTDEVSFYLNILLISYSLKTIISAIILFSGDTEYNIGGNPKYLNVTSIFGSLCVIECLVFGFQFGFSPIWDFVVCIFFLQIPSMLIGKLLDV